MHTSSSPSGRIPVMKDILGCFLDNNPERLEDLTSLLADMRAFITDSQELLNLLYEKHLRQADLILSLGGKPQDA